MRKTVFFLLVFFSYSVNAQMVPSFLGVYDKKPPNATGTVTFTNCSSTGRDGPSQSDCNTSYSGTSLEGDVTLSSGIQLWTVPYTGTYTIIVYGAQGGSTDNVGGKGAKMTGDFSLTQGNVIYILVGQQGLDSEDSNYSYAGNASNDGGGGGGGTFVVKKSGNSVADAELADILVIAGGGGGQTATWTDDAHMGQSGTSGGSTQSSGGGTDGSGGSDGNLDGPGAGGGGFLTDGENTNNGTGTIGGKSFLNGGEGGTGTAGTWGGSNRDGGSGGFGGGGGGWHNVLTRSGGGGGFSGGQGGSWQGLKGGGGGGSKNNGSNTSNVAGNNSGHGKVEISW